MIRFFNGRTLTMAHGVTVTTDEVWTDGDKIAYVGPTPETLPAFEREVDLGGDLVMPGFKNAHAHAGMSFVRSYADDVPLQPWLFEQIFPLEAKLTPEAVYAFTKLSILEYLTSGITAGFDMYYFRDAIAQASIDCGFRTVLCGGGGSAQQLEAEYRRFNALHPLVSYQLGLHSEYTSSLAEMTEAGELARTLRAPVFAHNAETAREAEAVRRGVAQTEAQLRSDMEDRVSDAAIGRITAATAGVLAQDAFAPARAALVDEFVANIGAHLTTQIGRASCRERV